ncbi:hypothetical protein J3A78_005574 [Streptomyces sp. PvR006]|uniref:hypothetical protein n=1 Tax=Streptomyces sp. PvR006 TaxID=2817860 RepID=UPI001AE6A927|nr:hypothetical protein [Streptomyces sp. PvR006]MBP2585096.1 hypothetical protein [Streptomyces sp. PvR006]
MTTTGRRALLTAGIAAAAATALPGCTAAEDPGPRKPSAAEVEAERVARAEAALRLRSVTASRSLLERYDAALAAHPALAPRLTPLRRSVAAHTKALGEGGTTVRPATAAPSPTATAPATATASAGASASARPAPSPAPVAADPRAALKELAAAERTTSDTHTAALVTAPPEYARLLASVAAAGAAHAYLLTEGARA